MILSSRGTRPFGPVSFDQPRGCSPGKRCVSADAKTRGASLPLITCLPYNLLILLSHSEALLDFVRERSQDISVFRLQQLESSRNLLEGFKFTITRMSPLNIVAYL